MQYSFDSDSILTVSFYKQILFEFEDRFKDVSSQSFVENWNKYSTAIQALFESQYDTSAFVTTWPRDIENILALLKLFPSSKVGKHCLANRATFHKASNKLFVFRTVNIHIHDFSLTDSTNLRLIFFELWYFFHAGWNATSKPYGEREYLPIHYCLR